MAKRVIDADTILNQAKPLTHQHAHEIQPFGHLVKLPIALAEKVCRESVDNLNQLLADTMTLRDLYKKHHWQLAGPTFYQLHLLFDKHYEQQNELSGQMGYLTCDAVVACKVVHAPVDRSTRWVDRLRCRRSRSVRAIGVLIQPLTRSGMSHHLLKISGGSEIIFSDSEGPQPTSSIPRRFSARCGASSSFDCRALDVFHSVDGHCGCLLFQFETECAQHGEDCGEVIEAHARRVAWRRRRQPHGGPSVRLNGEQPADCRAVHHRQICPVLDVLGKVVHVDSSCIQGVAPTHDKVVATFRGACVKNAVLLRDGRLLEIRASTCDGESVNGHRFLLNPHHELETIGEQPANHSLHSASLFALWKTGGNGVGGRFRLDIVGLAPARKTGKTRRWVDRHVVRVTQKQEHRHRARIEVTVWQHSHAHVARVG